MTIATSLQSFLDFNVTQATLTLWVFKKRSVGLGKYKFTAHSVLISDELKAALRSAVLEAQRLRRGATPYSLLSQVTEGEYLGIDAGTTIFQDLKRIADQPSEDHIATGIKHLQNASGYLVKLVHNGNSLYCVKKTSSEWQTKKSSSVLNAFFRNQEMGVDNSPSFSISKSFDFHAIDGGILVSSKAAFESILGYKETYTLDFSALQAEPAFSDVFTTIAPLVDFVGTNSTQLRRFSIIRDRGHYKDATFIQRLRQVAASRGWDINFDAAGKIIPCEITARTIIQVLLNHRLFSELTDESFDVPDAIRVP